MPFSLRCVQYMVTSILQDRQYMSTSVVDEEEHGRHVVSTTDATIAAVDSLVRSNWRVMR